MTEPAYYPSFKPPFLHRQHVLLLNALLLRSSSWTAAFGSGNILFFPLPETPEFSAVCALTVEIDGTLWQVTLDDTAFLLRHAMFHGETNEAPEFDERTLPQEVRRALLESMLIQPLCSLGNTLNIPFRIQDVDFLPEPAKADFSTGFLCRISSCNGLPELTFFFRLSPLQSDNAQALTRALKTLPKRSDGPLKTRVKTVPLEVALESGYLMLKPEEVVALSPEDVLLPEVWTAPETLTLRVGHGSGSLAAEGILEKGQVTISSPLSLEAEPPVMDNPDLKDIDIRLSFELERRTITVGELELLAPGYTFVLNCDATSPVTIRANGKAIALGRLVDVDGTLGVQITETL